MALTSLALSTLKIVLNGLLLCVLLIVGFEVAARLMLPDLVASWRALAFGDHRVLFISPEAFESQTGYLKFRPNSDIRDVAYYPEADGRFTVEYDCTFASDRLGYLSNSVPYEDSEILLLGDSFAQGSGGCAWLPRLAPAVRARLYSAAVLGTGVTQWRNILADLAKIKEPRKILMVFITHDFFRDPLVFGPSQLACLANRGDCKGQFWYPVSDRMAELAAERYALRSPRLGRSGMSKLLRYHLTASFTLFEKLKRRRAKETQTLQDSLAIVADLARRYPLKLVWVNDRAEIDAPGPRTKLLWSKLEGLDVTRCRIPAEGFLRRDGHPNAKGYAVLKACVERVVSGW